MAEYTGKNLSVVFNSVTLDADYRKLTTNEEIGMVESTAGGDTNKTYLTTIKDGKATLELLNQSGTVDAGVTVGTEADLVWGPEGTDTGKPRKTVNAILKSINNENAYADVSKLKLEFQFSGAVTTDTYP